MQLVVRTDDRGSKSHSVQ